MRHNLFLVVKEALNNVTRHARAGEVRLSVVLNGESATIGIEDNGIGFEDGPHDLGADGLRNMRQRMAEIGGRFSLETKPGGGTRISLTFPCPS
jgi:signal transduction histidine kinase